MKIAIIGAEMLPLPSIKGGSIEKIIDKIVEYVSKQHDITVLSIRDPELPNEEIIDGVRYLRFPRGYYWRFVINYFNNVKENFELIHIFNRPRIVPYLKRAVPQSKLILDVHNEVFTPTMLPENEGLECISSVDTIITVSNFIGEPITNRFPDAKKKIKTIYAGVDTDQYQPIWAAKARREFLRNEWGFYNKKVIMFVGRLIPKKGPHILIEAFKRVCRENPNAVLLIIGSPWYSDNTPTEYVKKLYEICKPIKDKVFFTNYISQDDMPDYYLMADLFVCPSQCQEAAARVHYEAMAAGLPIVTTNRGGNTEIISHQNNGLVINNFRNPNDFAMAINKILSRPDLAEKMGTRNRAEVKEKFDFKRMTADYLDVYEQVMG